MSNTGHSPPLANHQSEPLDSDVLLGSNSLVTVLVGALNSGVCRGSEGSSER